MSRPQVAVLSQTTQTSIESHSKNVRVEGRVLSDISNSLHRRYMGTDFLRGITEGASHRAGKSRGGSPLYSYHHRTSPHTEEKGVGFIEFCAVCEMQLVFATTRTDCGLPSPRTDRQLELQFKGSLIEEATHGMSLVPCQPRLVLSSK